MGVVSNGSSKGQKNAKSIRQPRELTFGTVWSDHAERCEMRRAVSVQTGEGSEWAGGRR